uniref:DSBA-like thioredoxin domain-containing protein n=1 Tax=Pseudictyota dubia TaxID=2749911 RepID=A0A6U2HFH7_9STRA|mmetsp:Transcript_47394/g.88017  ORF Transcript_47394/g.88017 Transcript_47394/m.88017 type:complete len:182 (+) Transcript_47394:407-952(+)
MASHRLVQHVGKRYGLRVSEGLYDRLNVYYFVEGHSLNDRERLASVAAETIGNLLLPGEGESEGASSSEAEEGEFAGALPLDPMSEEEVLAFLNGNEGRAEIETALQALQQLGIHGIPKFIIEGRTVVDGAAQSDVFVEIFRDIERRGEVWGGPVFAEILGINDDVVRRGSHLRPEVDIAA